MEKFKLNVSQEALAAFLCILSLINYTTFIILLLYIFIVEKNEWLRKTSAKITLISIVFSMIPVVISVVTNVFSILEINLGWFIPFTIKVPFSLDSTLRLISSSLEIIVLLLVAVAILRGSQIKLGSLDKLIDKHIGFNETETEEVTD